MKRGCCFCPTLIFSSLAFAKEQRKQKQMQKVASKDNILLAKQKVETLRTIIGGQYSYY
jgi:hypothetical protein